MVPLCSRAGPEDVTVVCTGPMTHIFSAVMHFDVCRFLDPSEITLYAS